MDRSEVLDVLPGPKTWLGGPLGGTGSSLAIAKELAEVIGGATSARNRAKERLRFLVRDEADVAARRERLLGRMPSHALR